MFRRLADPSLPRGGAQAPGMAQPGTATPCSYLGMKEDFGSEEPLVPDIYNKLGFVDGVDARVLFDPLAGVSVVLGKFLHYVGANVTVFLLLRNTTD